MIVYIYNKKTYEFVKEYSPQVNPKHPNEYLLPKNSTTVKPELCEGFIPVFDGEKWVQIQDLRGEKIINLKTKEITKLKKSNHIPENNVLYSEYIMSEEYKHEQNKLEQELLKIDLYKQILDLDIKRIRAICEPETREDGSTWLDFYNTKIVELRKKLKELE